VDLLAPVRSHIDGLVHPSAQQDALTCPRHRAVIAPRLLGRLVALAALRRSTVQHLRIEPRLPGAAEQPSNSLVKKSA
jgi:hypothetical protein